MTLKLENHEVTIADPRRSCSNRSHIDGCPIGELVRLTVVHDDFDAGSAVLESISEGWPRVLSGLKTLLETGGALPVGQA